MIGFEDKKYPSIMIQGVILATNIFFISHSSANIYTFLSTGCVLTLFSLQAVNHRFFYYSPQNQWVQRMTIDIDTVILYFMTFLALFFMIAGMFSFPLAFAGSTVICIAPFAWRHFAYKWIRDRITDRLKNDVITLEDVCPCCSKKIIIKRKVKRWNLGLEYQLCLGGCGYEKRRICRLNIG